MTDMKNVQVLLQSLKSLRCLYKINILTYFARSNMQTWRSHQTGDIFPTTVARVPPSPPWLSACSAINGRKERMWRSQGRMMMAGRGGSGHHATLNIPDNSFCPTGRRHSFSLHPVNWSWKLLSFLFLWFFPLNCEIFLTHCRFSKNGIKELI